MISANTLQKPKHMNQCM